MSFGDYEFAAKCRDEERHILTELKGLIQELNEGWGCKYDSMRVRV